MKNKITTDRRQCFQEILPFGCWKPVYRKKQNIWQRLFKQHQKAIDSALAGAAIALMFLTGIWVFLVQFAEYGG